MRQVIRYAFIKLRHFWYSLWIRRNEFHKSLEMDIEYYELLDKSEREKYAFDLMKRRNIAHERDLEKV